MPQSFAPVSGVNELALSLTWRRLTTAGAVTGVAFGLLSSIADEVIADPVP
jgi:Na+(H+)/acetate symporter ActP